ncbi:nuclear transport factor 2 family protein [Croceibacterium sp. LX-88]|uniref:Nuclear transport factor 2 family protein n=1 Tax=Croceibacterium selenioxidans TaxID=2838833 RepID=A0ABS5W7F4_9SPHN|nr:nuclear transport factor 2 family protein [Croceibacterium selenioxidans]MBT2135027.1 nuclear transport factor 2 family protein [Croceibacterium selenioxidans]
MSVSTACKSALAAAILALGALPGAASAAPNYSPTYGQDRAEIEDLMARYLFAIDYFDWDAYVATFTEDGELEFASGTSKGREAIREAVTSFAKGIGRFYHTEDGKPAILRHVVLQSSIRVEGERAWGRTLWLEMANHGPGDTMKMGTYGIYEDEFKKVDGQWLIAKRRVLNEFIPKRQSGPNNPVADMDAAAEAFLAGK